MNAASPPVPAFACPACGKQSYLSRRAARRAARTLYPGRRLRTYPCTGRFHLTSWNARKTANFRDYLLRRSQGRDEVAA